MLGHKVSRERIGTELDGMIKGPDPLTALDLLKSMGLFEAVFEVHPSATEDVTSKFAAAGCTLGKTACSMLLNWSDVFEGHDGLDLESADVRRQTILAALLLPLRYTRVPLNGNKTQSMSAHIVRDSLKWKSKDADMVELLHTVAPDLVDAYGCIQKIESSPSAAARIKLGRCVKKLKHLWPSGVFLACLLSSKEAMPIGVESAMEETVPWEENLLQGPLSESLDTVTDLHAHKEMCKTLESTIKAFSIHTCWQWKPLLNGKDVMKTLQMEKGGPSLGKAMDACFDYQLVHPEATKEEVTQFLIQNSSDIIQDAMAWDRFE